MRYFIIPILNNLETKSNLENRDFANGEQFQVIFFTKFYKKTNLNLKFRIKNKENALK